MKIYKQTKHFPKSFQNKFNSKQLILQKLLQPSQIIKDTNKIIFNGTRQISNANQFKSSIFVDVDDNTIDIEEGEKTIFYCFLLQLKLIFDQIYIIKTYKGSLIIVPTPIGNLGDLSLRQYEALTQSDIIACEDTRKTGKMIELIKQKRLKDKFKREFGATIDDFFNEKEVNDFKVEQEREHKLKGVVQNNEDTEKLQQQMIIEEDHGDEELLARLLQANQEIDKIQETRTQQHGGQKELVSQIIGSQNSDAEIDVVKETSKTELKKQVNQILQKLEFEIEANKFQDITQRKNQYESSLQVMTDQDRIFIEQIDQQYYTRVKSSDEYYRRKKLILANLDRLQRKVEATAKHFDDYERLRFIMLEKAKQKRSVLKNFIRFEQFNEKEDVFGKDNENQESEEQSAEKDDFDLLYGIENSYTKEVYEKIQESKKKKGRGLLLSFYEHNQEKRIPRLIRAMKLGLKVALVSDAGTPTISDPGYKFLRDAKKQGISIEALPGPCAATTALSASGFPSDRFQFYGYLSKTDSEREQALLEIMRQGKTTCIYESPNRLIKTLYAVQDIFGEKHEVYIGIELTKMHERHLRDPVQKVIQLLEQESEGSRIKGEITMVLAPFNDEELNEQQRLLRSSGFDPKKDAQIKVDLIQVATKLNEAVEMSEHDFRIMLKGIQQRYLQNKVINNLTKINES